MSDLHYDPFYNTPRASSPRCRDGTAPRLGKPGCDSPWALVHSAIADAFDPDRGASYAFFTGDWLRHDMSSEAASAPRAVREIADMLGLFDGLVFPVSAMGNHDFVPEYFFNLSAPPPPVLEAFTAALIDGGLLKESEGFSFTRCGFFDRVVTPRLSIVMLNTVLWSVSLSPVMAPAGSDPCGQLAWLKGVLQESREYGRKVFILAHIPPTISVWSFQFLHQPHAYFWQDQFTEKYSNLLRRYRDVVAFQFFGHTHKFSFLSDARALADIPAFVLPSISPVYNNNPSYFVATINDTTLEVTHVYQRFLNGTVWVDGHDLVRDLFNGWTPITGGVLFEAAEELYLNDTMWTAYTEVYAGGVWTDQFNGEGCNAACRRTFECSSAYISPARVFSCIKDSAENATLLPSQFVLPLIAIASSWLPIAFLL